MIKLPHSLTVIVLCSVLCSVLCFSNSWAHEDETNYDRVHLSVSATAQVENDTMVAIVYAQEEGGQAAALTEVVNKRIRWGLDLVKKYPEIKHQTNAYSSNPIYSKNKIKGFILKYSQIRLLVQNKFYIIVFSE